MEFIEYLESVRSRVDDIVESEAIPASEAYFRMSADTFVEYGIADSVSFINMPSDIKAGSKLIHADGYSFDSTDHSLSLYIYDYDNDYSDSKLTLSALEKLYWKLLYFLEVSCSDNAAKYLEEEQEALKDAGIIRSKMKLPLSDPERVLSIHFVVVTNRQLDTKLITNSFFEEKKAKKKPKVRKKIKQKDFDGRPLDIDLWPIDRFFEIEAADINELVEINFREDFGNNGIPCIKGNIGSNLDYDAYIGIIPGKLLADIYIEYGSKILEGNVRAFLGTKSAKGVNNGIKKTINNEPFNFFTYNNGIAATAADVITERRNNQTFITGVTDLQIINGGQTTATLAEAVLKKTNIDLEGIFVPFKLTVIADRERENNEGILVYDQMIHDIARFANSQNKVTAADLFSNDPFHVWMEKASKKYLAPPVRFNIPTGWYYERARKKYQQEQMKLKGDELKRFLAKYPKKQIITKEKLAMYITAVSCKPHLCSKGKNWVMKEYGAEIGEIYKKDKARFNEYYFKKCICAAIIYQTVDNYLESNKKDPDFWYSIGGFKGNIVPYTVSKIMESLPEGATLNWLSIWNNQSVSAAFMKEIEKVTFLANQYFESCGNVLISEHCKKETTWTTFRDLWEYQPEEAFIKELIPVETDKELSKSAIKDQKDTDELSVVMDVINKGSSYWTNLKQTAIAGNLLSNAEIQVLDEVIHFVKKGMIPCSSSGRVPNKTMTMIKNARLVESNLTDEGFTSYFEADDDIYELTITDYKMH